MLYRTLVSWGHIKVRPFQVDQIFVFLQLELAHQAECFLEIYALDIKGRRDHVEKPFHVKMMLKNVKNLKDFVIVSDFN